MHLIMASSAGGWLLMNALFLLTEPRSV